MILSQKRMKQADVRTSCCTTNPSCQRYSQQLVDPLQISFFTVLFRQLSKTGACILLGIAGTMTCRIIRDCTLADNTWAAARSRPRI